MSGILVYFHCGSNAGFAIERLERTFFRVACQVAGSPEGVHFAYASLDLGRPKAFPDPSSPRVLQIDPRERSSRGLEDVRRYVKQHAIRWALGFDQPPFRPLHGALRDGGVRRIVSYWGAPMSPINSGVRLWAKRLQVSFDRRGPDLYVFESEAMRATATHGRGVRYERTAVVHLGVDTDEFRPSTHSKDTYAHAQLGIPEDRQIVYYSGHMEPRKGVHVILRAAVELAARNAIRGVHFVLCGNRPGEAEALLPIIAGSGAEGHVTFAGYRRDVEHLMRSASIGTIASTGWDSFTMTAVELAASGVPLVVSNLQGLAETVVDGETGVLFPPGDHVALAERLLLLLANQDRLLQMGRAARHRAVRDFSAEQQVAGLISSLSGAPADARRRATTATDAIGKRGSG